MVVQRYLFELTAYRGGMGVSRMSEWISDDWLADELKRDTNLDRLVEIPDLGTLYPLPDEPIYFSVD